MDSDLNGQVWDDFVQPFQIESHSARGRLVRLGPLVGDVTARHDYPAPVAAILGELLALAAVVAGALKFDGVFTLQAKGDGPIRALMADITSDGEMRGYAQFDHAHFDDGANGANAADAGHADEPTCAVAGHSSVPLLLGSGYLAFTVDQGPDTDRYQGIVELAGATLADCAHAYFRQSEQLQAAVKLASVPLDGAGPGAAALMVQRLPGAGRTTMSGEFEEYEADDAWSRTVALMGTCTDAELLDSDLHPHRLLFRLFHEDGVRVFEPRDLVMKCRCTGEKVMNMLRSFPRAEIEDLKIGDKVEVTCEFCGAGYDFDEAALDGVYGA
jgi:molecular chaperone Hsp33